MKEKKKRNWKKITIYTAAGVGLAVIGGVVAYKKCPKFEKGINTLVSKAVGLFKTTKTPEQVPEINAKPFRKYERFYRK